MIGIQKSEGYNYTGSTFQHPGRKHAGEACLQVDRPYIIDKVIGDGTFLLWQFDGDPLGKPVNVRPYHRRADPEMESANLVAICHIDPLIIRPSLHGASFDANQIAAHEDIDEEPVFSHDDSLKKPYGSCTISKMDTWKKLIPSSIPLLFPSS